jgi:hypothetical protein
MVNLPMHIKFNLRIREVVCMHLKLGFHVNLNEKLPQPQMYALVSILSQI